MNGRDGGRPPLVELEPRYAWARQLREETATQTARIEDAKAAQARADAALEVCVRPPLRLSLFLPLSVWMKLRV